MRSWRILQQHTPRVPRSVRYDSVFGKLRSERPEEHRVKDTGQRECRNYQNWPLLPGTCADSTGRPMPHEIINASASDRPVAPSFRRVLLVNQELVLSSYSASYFDAHFASICRALKTPSAPTLPSTSALDPSLKVSGMISLPV